MTVPDLIVSDDAILAVVRFAEGEPELDFDCLSPAEFIDTRNGLTAGAPHLIRDWVQAVLAQYPYITPALLSDLADDLLTGAQSDPSGSCH
jgi:hypothetical protein